MAEFLYNNAKNASTSHMLDELNCGYYPWVSYKEDINLCFKSKSANELLSKLQELMTICYENLQHIQKLQKQAHDKNTKLKNYAPSNKVWLNSKYFKIKQN